MPAASTHTSNASSLKRVLIVDDEPELLRSLGLRLRAAGYDVLSATDGLTATRAAIHERPDAIVLDIGLPAGDGHVIARRLLDHPRTSGIPIIFLTARTTRDDVVLAQQHGAFAYLVKPYEPAELLAMVQHATSGRHRFEDIDMGPAA